MVLCFLHFHDMREDSMNMQNLEVDLLVESFYVDLSIRSKEETL